MPRTVETLQQVIHGLYPTASSYGTVPRVRVRHPQDENLMGNSYVCARLKELMVGFEKGMEALDIPIDGFLSAHGLHRI